MNSFKLDRTASKAHTRKEAVNHASVYKKLSWQDRLEVASYLNSVAFNFDMNNPPVLERAIIFKDEDLEIRVIQKNDLIAT
jgi:hypothetical protein